MRGVEKRVLCSWVKALARSAFWEAVRMVEWFTS
jgi:hypothetical protein